MAYICAPHNKALHRTAAFVTLLLLNHELVCAQEFGNVQVRTTPIKDGVHLLQGTGGNIAVFTGGDGTLIVDDEYAPLTDKVVAAIDGLNANAVEIVINTHWHNDHTGGNEYFGRAGALIVAHANSRLRMMTDQIMSLYGEQKAYLEVGWPKITFPSSMRLHYNGEMIDLIHFGPAHTDSDAIVFFRERNVMHTGDLFVGYGFRPPYIDYRNGGSTDGMIDAIGAVADLIDENTIIIPGHGELATGADVFEYRAMLIAIRERIKQAIARGQSEDESVSAMFTSGFAPAGRGTDQWVRMVYQEYR